MARRGVREGHHCPVRRLSVETGTREEVSRIDSTGDVTLTKTLAYFKPRVLATWTIHGGDQLRLRLEREVTQLEFNDFVATSSFSTGQVRAGNPDLVPQRADVAEITAEKHFAQRGAAIVTYRHSRLHDVLDRAPIFGEGGTFDAPANIGAGDEDEVIGSLTLPLGAIGLNDGLLKGDATWRRSAAADPTTGERRRVTGLYPFDGAVTISDDLPRRHLSLSATLHTGHVQTFYYFNQVEADRVLPYASVQATYRPSRALTVQLLAYDIGTRHDRRITTVSTPEAPAGPLANSRLASPSPRIDPIGASLDELGRPSHHIPRFHASVASNSVQIIAWPLAEPMLRMRSIGSGVAIA